MSAAASIRAPKLETRNGEALPVRSSTFKFYIHDRVDSLRLELVGDFLPGNVVDLRGVWETAETTLGKRNLVVDLKRLQNSSAEGDQWIRTMRDRGAKVEDKPKPTAVTACRAKLSFWSKILRAIPKP